MKQNIAALLLLNSVSGLRLNKDFNELSQSATDPNFDLMKTMADAENAVKDMQKLLSGEVSPPETASAPKVQP